MNIVYSSVVGVCFVLAEVLSDPVVLSRLADTKASGEVKSLDDFYQMLQNDPDRAFYGLVLCPFFYQMLQNDPDRAFCGLALCPVCYQMLL